MIKHSIYFSLGCATMSVFLDLIQSEEGQKTPENKKP